MSAPNHKTRFLTLKVWAGIFLYALLAGFVLQLLILPHIFPQLHAGNGLLVGRDWVGFHEQAAAHAQKVILGGWGEFLLRPDGDNAITGVAAFLYVLWGPHPWVLLPLNALMFAMGGVALFSMLRQLGLNNSEAIISLLPYLLFPSALLQYGQIHKDVFCTAGVLVALWSLTRLLRGERTNFEILPLLMVNTVALIVVTVFRPYFMYPFLGLEVAFLLWYLARIGWRIFQLKVSRIEVVQRAPLKFDLQSVIILTVLALTTYLLSVSYLNIRFRPTAAVGTRAEVPMPIFVWQSNKNVRSADRAFVFSDPEKADVSERINSVIQCRLVVILKQDAYFENAINRIFLKIAVARAGFNSSGGTTVASNIDKEINFCKNEDLIRYIPRALQIALFAPFPSSWLAIERRNSSSVEIYISAVEMFYCYIAYIGLLYWLFSYRRWTVALLLPVTFALGMTLLLGLTVANVGTLYRMRFPFAMIFVSIGMAGILQLAKIRPPWVEKLDSSVD